MLRVCVVKHHATYDLFTRTGPDVRAIVDSSNWRTGPIGLWEAFDTTARIVWADDAPECQIGKRHWGAFVEGWDVWPAGSVAEDVDAVDWGAYDVVISIDIAVPTRIVDRFPQVMWCYYFIEGGPTGIDGPFRGSPFYGYNVFLDHRLARTRLTPSTPSLRRMRATRRAVLDFPYYMMSARSVRRLYPELAQAPRAGVCLSHHSRKVLTPDQLAALEELGPVRTEWTTIADIHRAEVQSAYLVVHPESQPTAGLALIEAVSAGCLALAPSRLLWGFPELALAELEYDTFDELLGVLRRLERDADLAQRCRQVQQRRVEDWCYANPAADLEAMLGAFRASRASGGRQRLVQRAASVRATGERAALRVVNKARSLARERRAGRAAS